jgi:putative ATPase
MGGATNDAAPLADRMRPRTLADVVGQTHLLGPGGFLGEAVAGDRVPSLVLWGPPGSGKTTLALVISRITRSEFVTFSAVLGGVAELRELIAGAKERRHYQGRRTILFVDEIHHFNRHQQDAFLPHLEDGTITLIGATTENPSFAVNAALLSRCKVLRLEALSEAALATLLERALRDRERGLGQQELSAEPDALAAIAREADGDARRALNLLETAASLAAEGTSSAPPGISMDLVRRAAEARTLLYDRAGEEHYNVVSALIKSMRGSDPDAAIYWLMRMLDAGDDPLFLLRRLIIFASEDIGNADPRALAVSVNADLAFRRVGMPEGIYPIAHACLYLAACPKSNSVGRAFMAARELMARHGSLPVPMSLRNPVSELTRQEGYGKGYDYPHDHAQHFAPEVRYLPDALAEARLYHPGDQGLEKSIAERLERLRAARNGR